MSTIRRFHCIRDNSKQIQNQLGYWMKQTKTSFWLIILIPLPYSLGKRPKFHLIFGCGNFVEKRSFRRVSGDSSDTLWKLCVSIKFPHQEMKSWYFTQWFLFGKNTQIIGQFGGQSNFIKLSINDFFLSLLETK